MWPSATDPGSWRERREHRATARQSLGLRRPAERGVPAGTSTRQEGLASSLHPSLGGSVTQPNPVSQPTQIPAQRSRQSPGLKGPRRHVTEEGSRQGAGSGRAARAMTVQSPDEGRVGCPAHGDLSAWEPSLLLLFPLLLLRSLKQGRDQMSRNAEP